MPGGDRTGPWGAGPLTGRGAGYCAGFNMPGYANPIPGRGMGFGRGGGFGRGRGMGWGFRHMYYATGQPGWAVPPEMPYEPVAEFSEQDELKYLKQRSKYFGKVLDDISRRINELEKSKEK
ncbi:MAG: hypothetical protein DRP46_08740 [Candidatus Zixiibacteriota bacterium]|nr:MAG: hypothetical protein DRP46_08740 [candidate division Zixibacteria bacterium]